jgi:mannose-1-phosphate guanylyltransferase
MKNLNNVNNVKIGVAILAGGSGTRLWPLSNPGMPKPFIPLGEMGSLYDEAVKRAFSLSPSVVFTVAAEKILPFCKKEGVELLQEPCAKNTAPAVALAGLYLKKQLGEDAVLVVLPADHSIPDTDRFRERFLALASLASRNNGFGLIGISPTYPATGYGYIEIGEEIEKGYKVNSFREKPDHETAEKMVKSGKFLWNSGMFAFPVGLLESEMKKHSGSFVEAAFDYLEKKEEKTYRDLKPDSIDFALMEKTETVYVVRSDFRWSDVGNFKSLYELLPKDEDGNAALGEARVENCRNCLIISDKREFLARDLEGMVVAKTGGGVLATPLKSSEEIKKGVESILADNDRSKK